MSSPPVLPDPPRRFGAAVWYATAPLLLWALHFFVLYPVVAAACMRGWGDARWAGLPLVNVVLLGFSAVAVALTLAMLRHSWQERRLGKPHGEAVSALRWAGGWLALVGILWDTAPLLMIPPCG